MSSAYNRIGRQNRPKVAKRLDPLNDSNQKYQQSENTSPTEPQPPTNQISETTDTIDNNDFQTPSDILSSNTDHINSKYLQFKTVSASWRIHPEVKKALDSLIDENNSTDTIKITKDTFVEAAIFICQQNPQILESVLQEARIRQAFRNQAGAYKRSISTMQKLNQQQDNTSSIPSPPN